MAAGMGGIPPQLPAAAAQLQRLAWTASSASNRAHSSTFVRTQQRQRSAQRPRRSHVRGAQESFNPVRGSCAPQESCHDHAGLQPHILVQPCVRSSRAKLRAATRDPAQRGWGALVPASDICTRGMSAAGHVDGTWMASPRRQTPLHSRNEFQHCTWGLRPGRASGRTRRRRRNRRSRR